jgi:hypothetical protein
MDKCPDKTTYFRILIVLATLLLVFQGKAHAYIDPGAGSMLLQVIIGSVLGGIYWFREWIYNIFRKIFRK